MGLLFFLLGLLFINTCKRIYLDPNEFTEGKVVYQISYPKLDTNHLFEPFLPHKMILTIKGKKLKLETKTGLGLFQTGFTADLRDKEAISHLKLINVRYKCNMDTEYFKVENEENPYQVVTMDSMSTYLGEAVSFAKVSYPWSDEPSWLMMSSNRYAENINFHNGFFENNKLLLEYEQRFQGVVMHFKAIEFIEESVSKNDFKLDSDYQELSRVAFLDELKKTLSPLAE